MKSGAQSEVVTIASLQKTPNSQDSGDGMRVFLTAKGTIVPVDNNNVTSATSVAKRTVRVIRGWLAKAHTFLLPPIAILPKYEDNFWDKYLVQGNRWLDEHVYDVARLPHCLSKGHGKLILSLSILALWFGANLLMIHFDRYAASTQYGTPYALNCPDSFWLYKDGCGVNGTDCLPFANDSLAFKCPAGCVTGGGIRSTILFGNGTIGFGTRQVIGDNSVGYRSDSWICQAAVHAGMFKDSTGGCGMLNLIGTSSRFPSVSANGISSLSFYPSFPSSFQFSPCTSSYCTSLVWDIYGLNVAVLFMWVFFLRPSNQLMYSVLMFVGFFTPAMITEYQSGLDYISTLFGTIFGAVGVSYTLYQMIIKHTVPTSSMTLHRIFYILPLYWVGVTWGSITANVPLDQLTGGRLLKNPGALTFLVVGCAVLFVLVLYQILTAIRPARMFYIYLGGYASAALFLYLITLGPLIIHVHHYIVAILLLPLTRFRTPLSMVASAVLFGLFLNGVGRFGFSSLLQTSAHVIGTQGTYDSLIPTFVNVTSPSSLAWQLPPPYNTTTTAANLTNLGYSGYSLLCNDVERYSGPANSVNLTAILTANNVSDFVYYVRVAMVSTSGSALDYSDALTLYSAVPSIL